MPFEVRITQSDVGGRAGDIYQLVATDGSVRTEVWLLRPLSINFDFPPAIIYNGSLYGFPSIFDNSNIQTMMPWSVRKQFDSYDRKLRYFSRSRVQLPWILMKQCSYVYN
jgi:hypothetical protein